MVELIESFGGNVIEIGIFVYLYKVDRRLVVLETISKMMQKECAIEEVE